jgi:hypothetical protein
MTYARKSPAKKKMGNLRETVVAQKVRVGLVPVKTQQKKTGKKLT